MDVTKYKRLYAQGKLDQESRTQLLKELAVHYSEQFTRTKKWDDCLKVAYHFRLRVILSKKKQYNKKTTPIFLYSKLVFLMISRMFNVSHIKI